MKTEMQCDDVRELAPELALDIATGAERDAALRHLTTCRACSRIVVGFSGIAEELLQLAPPREPPAGFEGRVLEAVGARGPSVVRFRRRARPRWTRVLAAVAALVLSAAVGAWGVLVATGSDRRLGESYRSVLAEGRGSFFSAASLRSSDGRVGAAFAYAGDPSWIVVALEPGVGDRTSYAVDAGTRAGEYVSLG